MKELRRYTIATVSYTDTEGERVEEKIKFLDVCAMSNYELYKHITETYPTMKKPYVKEIHSRNNWVETKLIWR